MQRAELYLQVLAEEDEAAEFLQWLELGKMYGSERNITATSLEKIRKDKDQSEKVLDWDTQPPAAEMK